MEEIKQKQFDSLINLAEKFCSYYPGIEANVSRSGPTLEYHLIDREAFSQATQVPLSELDFHVKYAMNIDLHEYTSYINSLYKDLIDEFSSTVKLSIKVLDNIKLFAIADNFFYAKAYPDKTVVFSTDLISKFKILGSAFYVITNYHVFKDQDKFDSKSIIHSVGHILKSLAKVGEPVNANESDAHNENFNNAYFFLKNNKIPDLTLKVEGLQEWFFYFLIVHEFMHIILLHNEEYPVVLHEKLKKTADKTFTQEYEADLFAVAVIKRMCEKHGLDIHQMGFKISFCFALFQLINTIKPEEKKKYQKFRGHPDAYERFYILLSNFIGHNDMEKRPDLFNIPLGGLRVLHDYLIPNERRS